MKKGIKNSLISLCLIGLLAGCQNPTYWSLEGQRGTTKYTTTTNWYNTKKEIFFQKEKPTFPEKGKIEVPLEEHRTDYYQESITSTTPIQTVYWTAQQKPRKGNLIFPSMFVGIITAGVYPAIDTVYFFNGETEKTWIYKMSCKEPHQKRIRGTERINSKPKITSYDTVTTPSRKYTKLTEGPAINKEVNLSSPNLRLDSTPRNLKKRTDDQGILRATFSPLEGFLTQEEAEEFSIGIVEETYKPSVISTLTNGLSFSEPKQTELSLQTKDDELTVKIPYFLPMDNRPVINAKIRSQLEEYLTEKFPLKTVDIEVRQKDSKIYLNGILMESKQTAGPTINTVLTEQELFLSNFLKHKSDYSDCSINPSDHLSFIPDNFRFDRKTTIRINQGASYSVTFVHPDHYAAEKEIDFEKIKGNFFPVEMARLPAPVIQSEAKEGDDKSIITIPE